MLWHPLGGEKTRSNNCLQKSGEHRKTAIIHFLSAVCLFVALVCLFVLCGFLLYFYHIFLVVRSFCLIGFCCEICLLHLCGVFVYCCRNVLYEYLSSRFPIMFYKYLSSRFQNNTKYLSSKFQNNTKYLSFRFRTALQLARMHVLLLLPVLHSALGI